MERHNERAWRVALIDLDGTLYWGNRPVPGAAEFVARLRRRCIQPVFFTNNATRTAAQVCAKLTDMGIDAHPDEVATSAQATASFIQRRFGAVSVGVLGEGGLVQALQEAGLGVLHAAVTPLDDLLALASAAVLGLDRGCTYNSLAAFCRLVSHKGEFIQTNTDVRLPTPDGYLPGNGALGSFVQTATGVTPYVVGKPNPAFVDFVLDRYQCPRDSALVIGDNARTDVAAGKAAGVYTIQVQTGVQYSHSERLGQTDAAMYTPDEIAASVNDLFC